MSQTASDPRIEAKTSVVSEPIDLRRRRERRSNLLYSLGVKIGALLIVLTIWEVAVRVFAAPFIARPTGVIGVLPEVVTSGALWESVAGTVLPIFQGLFISIIVAVPVGLVMGRVRWAEWSLRIYLYALFALPMVALVPLVTMWLGYTVDTRLAIVIFAAFFPMALNVYDGTKAVSQSYLEVADSFGAPRRAVWFGVVLPASLPYLIAGFRLASGRALVAAVVAEMLVALEGLGRFIQINARSFRHNEAIVGVLVIMLFGLGMIMLARWATARFFPWYGENRKS